MYKFDIWHYSETNNCWDYVRQWMIDIVKASPDDVPKFGILPSDKARMTSASESVKTHFIEIESPEQNAIACQYRGDTLLHVGIVDSGRIRHVKNKNGVKYDTIKQFSRFNNVKYFKYANHQCI